jgi:hypothetical protein
VSKEERKMYGDLAKELGASKKKAPEKPKMTKQELEVFNEKLAYEAEIRGRVASVLMRVQVQAATEYAHVCSRMLTYAHVCSRMLTDAC